ncbi:AAA family ATPase [Paenibacillus rigui]|uniref:Shikimate kinase n=1 Tax=Paenibacillus rigui TaxID=554312 RepID=A0A229USV5_9BACL|nr:ATP-binding protein [Paenibacillus rigui]OXM86474.1 shikimate kinase [Paenibacillus rigui]
MEPTVIFLIGSAGSGKSTIGKLIASEYHFCYLDKDIVCNKFTGRLLESNGYSPHDRDGNAFYSDVVMGLEYQTLLDIANDNLQLGRSVVLDAPFLGYFANKDYIRQLKETYGWTHVKPLVVQVTIDFDVLKERMQARGLERDAWKFDNWDAFVQGIKEKQCLWEDIEIIQLDNSPAVVDIEKLRQTLPFEQSPGPSANPLA